MAKIAENLNSFEQELYEACEAADRDPASIKLIGVSKFHSLEEIREARDLGLLDLGENRAQEFVVKYEALKDENPKINWHFIGHLQRNKVKDIVGRTDLIHSVDSERLLRAIHQQAESRGIIQKILLQVNFTGEIQKYGFTPEEIKEVTQNLVEDYPNVELHGLMCMAELDATEARLEETFTGVQDLLAEVRSLLPSERAAMCVELSMGMSSDYQVAIVCGATMVRIGTAIFGERKN